MVDKAEENLKKELSFAIQVLQKAAVEIAGEIMTNLVLEQDIEKADDINKFAYNLLFENSINRIKSEKAEQFLELIKAIRILKDANTGTR